jgi:hypothetical protein
LKSILDLEPAAGIEHWQFEQEKAKKQHLSNRHRPELGVQHHHGACGRRDRTEEGPVSQSATDL